MDEKTKQLAEQLHLPYFEFRDAARIMDERKPKNKTNQITEGITVNFHIEKFTQFIDTETPSQTSKNAFDFAVFVTPTHLALKDLSELHQDPIHVDFVEGKEDYRRRYFYDTIIISSSHGENLKTPMIRAIRSSGKPLSETTVLDATGGLCKDAFVFATLGCHVEVIEQHPVLHCLIQDGIERGMKNTDVAPTLSRITLKMGDSRNYMKTLDPSKKPDVVYLQ